MMVAYDSHVINGIIIDIVTDLLYYDIYINDKQDYLRISIPTGLVDSTSLDEFVFKNDSIYVPKYDLTFQLTQDGLYVKAKDEEYIFTTKPELDDFIEPDDTYNGII